MAVSIASAAPRNLETVRVSSLIPPAIESSAKNLVGLLEEYYNYLNTEGLPSAEIQGINTLKDIDNVSAKYLDQIEELIGKNIPQSSVLNRVELYKVIVKYYTTRGSEDSIHSFFKIFFNETVKIIYPKEQLFKLSEGQGSWSIDNLIELSGELALVRQLSDESTLTLGGITYDAWATDGSGQLISVEYAAEEAGSGIIDLHIDNGIITITPGSVAHLIVDSDDVDTGFGVYPIATDFYSTGLTNGRPAYSENVNPVTPFVGTPSEILWDGFKWEFRVGSELDGIVTSFYSLEDVATPDLVTAWTMGWSGITGAINSIVGATSINAQIFLTLFNSEDILDILYVETDALSPEYLADIVTTPREYLTSYDLPSDVEPGRIAVVNGKVSRPYVSGIASLISGNIVWELADADEWVYTNHKSFASDDYKIFDGYYWQDYSYVVKSDLDSSLWHNDYIKFVHPAGLKLFSAIAIEIVSRNEWFEKLDYTSEDVLTDDTWMKALVPPHNLNPLSIGYHTPKYQPGYLRDQVLRYLFTYLFDPADQSDYVRLVLLDLVYTLEPADFRNTFVRDQYLNSGEMFVDACRIDAGFLDKTIEEFEELYSESNRCRHLNLSAFITTSNAIDFSYYDYEEGFGSPPFNASGIDVMGGDGEGDFNESYYENVVMS